MVTTYLTFLIAHFIGDFPLQAGKIYDWKVSSNLGLGLHVLIHVGASMLLIQNPLTWWWVFALLGISHFTVDWIKLRVNTKPQWIGFILDQIVHILLVIPLIIFAPSMTSILPARWVTLDFVLILIPVLLLLFWVIVFDRYTTVDTTTPRRIFWLHRRGLAASQIIGTIVTIFVGIQALGWM